MVVNLFLQKRKLSLGSGCEGPQGHTAHQVLLMTRHKLRQASNTYDVLVGARGCAKLVARTLSSLPP